MKLSLFEKDVIFIACIILYLIIIGICVLYINDILNFICKKKEKEKEMKLINDNSSNNKDEIIYYNALYNE